MSAKLACKSHGRMSASRMVGMQEALSKTCERECLQKGVRCVLVLRDNVSLIVTYLPVILVIQQIGLLRNKQQLLMMQKPISETVVQPPQ